MPIDPNPIMDALQRFLKDYGFSRKRNTWYRDHLEAIQVINLQKSQFGAQFYINCAIWPKTVGARPHPVEYHCPIRARLDYFAKQLDRHDALVAALDLETDLPPARREEIVLSLLETQALPALDRWSVHEHLKADFDAGLLNGVMLALRALQLRSPA